MRIDKVATGSYFGCMKAIGIEVLKKKLSDAIRRGVVTPATQPHAGPPGNIPTAPIEEILKDLREDRDAR